MRFEKASKRKPVPNKPLVIKVEGRHYIASMADWGENLFHTTGHLLPQSFAPANVEWLDEATPQEILDRLNRKYPADPQQVIFEFLYEMTDKAFLCSEINDIVHACRTFDEATSYGLDDETAKSVEQMAKNAIALADADKAYVKGLENRNKLQGQTIARLEVERDMAKQNATMQAEQYEALSQEKAALQKDVDLYIKMNNEKSEKIHALERELTALRMGRDSYTRRIL